MNNLGPLALFSFLLLLPARAQDAPPPVPPPVAPFTRLPAQAAWEIEVTAEKPPAAPASAPGLPAAQGADMGPQLTRMESIKDGDVKHDTAFYSDGTKENRWYVKKFVMQLDARGQVAVIYPEPGSGVYSESVYSTGFPGVSWIEAADYQNVAQKDSFPCYFFERKKGDTVAAQAWIDVRTGLPRSVQLGSIKYAFRFKAPPAAGSLTLPSPFAEAWKGFAQLEARRWGTPPTTH